MTRADTPVEWGEDIDVPAMAWKSSPGGPDGMAAGFGWGVVPARIWMPGAVTSGLMKLPTGPRDEKAVMTSGVTGVG